MMPSPVLEPFECYDSRSKIATHNNVSGQFWHAASIKRLLHARLFCMAVTNNARHAAAMLVVEI
jgi:hypothetical protein